MALRGGVASDANLMPESKLRVRRDDGKEGKEEGTACTHRWKSRGCSTAGGGADRSTSTTFDAPAGPLVAAKLGQVFADSKNVLFLFPDLFLDFPPFCLSRASTVSAQFFRVSFSRDGLPNGPDGLAAEVLTDLQGAPWVRVTAPSPTGDAPAAQPPPAGPIRWPSAVQPEPVEPAVATGHDGSALREYLTLR